MTRSSVLLFVGLMLCAQVQAFSPDRQDESDSLIRLQKPRFLIYYNINRNCPALVVWALSKSDLGHHRRPASQSFLIDPACPRPRAKYSDYTRTGFQRGHLCPSADRSANIELMRATFVMSNVAPMCPVLNMQGFAQAEEHSRSLAWANHRCLLMAGAYFSSDTLRCLGKSSVGIPDSFFRACIVPDAPSLSVFWLFPNNAQVTRETPYRVPLMVFRSAMRRKIKNILDEIYKLW